MPEPLEELARAAEITPVASVGEFLGQVDEGDGVVSLLFAPTMPGYPGWKWTVSIAHVEGAEPTVLEAELMPAEGALLSPDWVPWADRLAEYQASQEALEAAAASEGDADSSDDDDLDGDPDEDDEVEDDLDDHVMDDDDVLGSDVLHGGDLDGVDIDDLDSDDDDSDDDDEEDEDESDDSDDDDPDDDDDFADDDDDESDDSATESERSY